MNSDKHSLPTPSSWPRISRHPGPRTCPCLVPALGSAALWLACSSLPAPAQVPEIIHYQARITVGNQNFNGNGDFKFALVNGDGSESFWSNDGQSANGSEPIDSVPIDVDKGLYSVLLGDTSVPNMQAIPTTVFTNTDVRLRIWFDDNSNGFELLTPDQRIVSVGYAMMAQSVPNGAITQDQLADGAVTADKIAQDAITSDVLADTITLKRLNLGGLDWDGSLYLYAKPNGGGGGIINPSGALRGELEGDTGGAHFNLLMSNGEEGAALSSRAPGGQLKLWDGLGTQSVFLGTVLGGGDLNLFQINGNKGIILNGDAGAFNQPSAGGEIEVYNAGGVVGLRLDGDHSAAGRVELLQADGTTYVDLFANGSNGAGEIRVKDDNGITTLLMDGNGPDAGLTGNGLLQLGRATGANLVLDNNEITARNDGAQAPLYLNPNQGNVVVGRTTELTPDSRLLVESDPDQDALRVRVGTSTKLYVSGSGQVGINTTNLATGYELNVRGQIICEELLVQSYDNWPDYVFADDYPLPSLEEVEASIAAHRHLPGIPPAAEVEGTGISVGDMQRRMMEKIEELTLYVIDQNKRLNAQEAELQALRARMAPAR